MKKSSKRSILKGSDTYNPHSEQVNDTLFQELVFFEAEDLLQVKYEMLRRVHREGWSVARSAKTFGFSRVSYYKIDSAFQKSGLSGLLPNKRGPKGAHKLTDDVLDDIQNLQTTDSTLSTEDLLTHIHQKWNVDVHPRTLERVLEKRKKKHRILSKEL